jgi:16S rRNA (cytosine967-C5)-methyltransferase
MKDARRIAFEILRNIEVDSAYSNISINAALKKEQNDEVNSALLSALVYATLERIITIDYNLSLYLKEPISKLRPEILSVLRLGVCQLLFMDKIPVSAAVNESVKIIKSTRYSFAAGLVNAVLRKVSNNGLQLPKGTNNDVEYLSVKYSCPSWLVLLWIKSYGQENTVGMLEYFQKKPCDFIRVNNQNTTAVELIQMLEKEGVHSTICEKLENAGIVEIKGAVDKISSFQNGYFHFQDISSQLYCSVLNAKVGDTVIDLCAAPGGKTFTLAETVGNSGKVFAFDFKNNRLSLIKNGAKRLHLTNIIVDYGDASVYNENIDLADIVICDVPCSGFGVIHRKPEIRYKNPKDIDNLPNLQYFILCNALMYVKINGIVAYSTCTLNPKENEDVCERFLKEHKNFVSEPIHSKLINTVPGSRFTTLLPHMNDSDGFFFALFKRMS